VPYHSDGGCALLLLLRGGGAARVAAVKGPPDITRHVNQRNAFSSLVP